MVERAFTSWYESLLLRFLLLEPLKYAAVALLPDHLWERAACPRQPARVPLVERATLLYRHS